jgi:hypothetical protein
VSRSTRRGSGTTGRRFPPPPGTVDESTPKRDRHARSVLEARLGRPARDVLEATVVLEAWTGRPARSAMATARSLVKVDGPPLRAFSSPDPFADSERSGVFAEGLTLVLLIVSIAAWASPIRRDLGPNVLSDAIRVALPLSIAFQWALRSRYLGRPHGLACLARDGVWRWALLLAFIDAPLVFIHSWGPVAAMLLPIWIGGTVLTRRGWGLYYSGVLLVATFAMDAGAGPLIILGALTTITLLMCQAAVRTSRQETDERAGPADRSLLAAVIGGIVGVLLVADPTLALGVRGAHPAIALLPSVVGSYWGGYFLWNFFDAVPRGLRGQSLGSAGRRGLTDPAMSIFLGAMVRLFLAVLVLSAVVYALGGLLGGTDQLTVFVAFGSIGILSMLIGMLESFSLTGAALFAAALALIVEIVWPHLVGGRTPGVAMAAAASLGILLTLPPLLVRLTHTGGTLATTLWIR